MSKSSTEVHSNLEEKHPPTEVLDVKGIERHIPPII